MRVSKERLLKVWEFILIEYHPEYYSMFEYYRLLDQYEIHTNGWANEFEITLKSENTLLFLVLLTNLNATNFFRYRIRSQGQGIIETYRGDLSITQIRQIEKLL